MAFNPRSAMQRRGHDGIFRLTTTLAIVGLCTVLAATTTLGCNSSGDPGDGAVGGGGSGSGEGVSWAHVQRHWISSNEDPRYPSGRYLVGIGIAPYTGSGAYDAAENHGRERILAFLETTIQSDFQSYQEQITRVQGAAPPEIRGEIFSRSSLSAIVRGSLPGGDVQDRVVDPQGDNVYVLVTVEKRTFADNLKVQIDELTARIRTALRQARTHRDRGSYLGALRGYSPILAWHQELVGLIQQYNLVRPAGYPALGFEFDIEEILEEMLEVALQLTFAFKVEARAYDPDGNLLDMTVDAEGEIIRQLGDRGIQVIIARSTPAFRQAPVSAIRDMPIEEVRDLLNADVDVNYIVTGTLELRYSSSSPLNGQEMLRYLATYNLEVIALKANETMVLADPVGRGQGGGQTVQRAVASTLLSGARYVAQDLERSFTEE